MKFKTLLFMSLLIGAVACSKDEPLSDEYIESMLNSYAGTRPETKIETPKGWISCKLVSKDALPVWLQIKTESITRGYIMKAGTGDDLLYFVYDLSKENGQFYDAQGNPTADNVNLKDWLVIYRW